MVDDSSHRHITFYFDFISPFSYFAWYRLSLLQQQHDFSIDYQPVVFGKLLDHWGQLGPAEIPPKREWLLRYCLRYTAMHQIPFQPPPQHPFNPLLALRLALPEVSGDAQPKLIAALYHAAWGAGQNIADETVVSDCLQSIDIDAEPLLAQTREADTKQTLATSTTQAIEHGVFGVPSWQLGNEIFWGNDQLEQFEHCLIHGDAMNWKLYEAMLKRGRAIDRKRVRPDSKEP